MIAVSTRDVPVGSRESSTTSAAGLDDDELRLVLQRVSRRIRNNRGDENLGDSLMAILSFLFNEGSASPSELAGHERVSPPSINRSLNALERLGLIRRDPGIDDARRISVSLTATGRRRITETRRLRTEWFSVRLAELAPGDRAVLTAALPVLRALADS